jgi:hypothetical protein
MSDWVFDRDTIRAFRFVRCGFDAATGIARLVYAFDDGPELVETVTLPGAPFALDDARGAAAERALQLLHLIAGVSYYKAAVPGEMRIEGYDIDAATAALLETVYLNGLGEFAYRNGLDLRGRIRFPHAGGAMVPRDDARPARVTRWSRSAAARIRWSASRRCAPSRRGADGDVDRRLAADRGLRRAHRPADAQHRPPAGAAVVRPTTAWAPGTDISR